MVAPRLARAVATAVVVGAGGLIGWAALGSPGRSATGPDEAAATAATAAPGDGSQATPATAASAATPPPDLGPALGLVDISGWLNTTGTSFDEVRGKVTVVQFWTFGCSNCKATLPHLQDLYADHHDQGLEIIGVHAHEFDYERDPDNIAAAVEDLGVTWPVALDSDKVNFRAWQGSPAYWPRTYVVDGDGRIRFDHVGEGAYDDLEQTVRVLLAAP